MKFRSSIIGNVVVLVTLLGPVFSSAQEAEYQWVNPLPAEAHPRLSHGTFRSASMGVDVGFVIYLPPGYEDQANAQRRYPVVYHLHGGLRGTEIRSIGMTTYFDQAIESGLVPPRIYVFVNGGPHSHYDYGGFLAETAFVKELIPHIDGTYRTISARSGRSIEGFSAGGRGTARIAFAYPELFCAATPMAGGHQHEKLVSEDRAMESNSAIPIPRDYNSWDRASQYAARESAPELDILVVVGTEDMNYESNMAWMDHLASLGIPFENRIVPGVGHNMRGVFSQIGDEIIRFPEGCFQQARSE